MWPVRHPLQEGELLSTWMARSGASMGLHAKELYALSRAGPYRHTNYDIDCGRDLDVLIEISKGSGIQYDRLLDATMLRYDGLVFENKIPAHARQWIITSGLTKLQAVGGHPVCLSCLASDPIPYFRSSWRLVCHPFCELHQHLLVTSCQQCGAPIRPWAYAATDDIPNLPYCTCHSCGADYRDQRGPVSGCLADSLLAQVTSQIDSGCISGVSSGSHQYSIVFCQGWGISIALLASRRWGAKIYALLKREVEGIEPLSTNFNGSVGALDPAARLNICATALLLLEEWPDRFIRICRNIGVGMTELELFRGGVPFWMASGVGGALDPRYRPNRDEVLAASAALSKVTAYPNRHKLEAMIGVIECKHIDQQLKPMKTAFSRREVRNFFACFDREIKATPQSKGRKYRLARDRTIIVMVCFGGYDLREVCNWTWNNDVIQELLAYHFVSPKDPPAISSSGNNSLQEHLRWFVSSFPLVNNTDAGCLFRARNGQPIDIESVRITAGQIKRKAGLQRIATCITGIARPSTH